MLLRRGVISGRTVIYTHHTTAKSQSDRGNSSFPFIIMSIYRWGFRLSIGILILSSEIIFLMIIIICLAVRIKKLQGGLLIVLLVSHIKAIFKLQ